jgi:hypothetical protein
MSQFSVFAVFVIVRSLMGFKSCGCSGFLDIPGWVFGGFDVAIAAKLLATPRRRQEAAVGLEQILTWWKSCSGGKRGRFVGLVLFLVSIVFIQLPICAPLRDVILGKPPVQSEIRYEGGLKLGQRGLIEAKINNHSMFAVEVMGVSKSCRCVATIEEPTGKTIPSNENLKLLLAVMPQKTGAFRQRVTLFLNHPKQFRVNIDVVGFVSGDE